VKNSCYERCVGARFGNDLRDIGRITGTTRGDYWNWHAVYDPSRKLEVVPRLRPIAIDAGEKNFTGPTSHRFASPLDRIEIDRGSAAVSVNAPPVAFTLCIDADHNTLRSESISGLCQERRPVNSRRVDAHFVGTSAERGSDVVRGSYSPAYRERNEYLLCRFPRDVEHGSALFRRCADIEEDYLIGACPLVRRG
jgi:hypothetical protein